MIKFWNKAEGANEIFIYGEITGETFFDTDMTAKHFTDDLKKCLGQDVTVRINSPGGDVFAAIAIGNVLKKYSGKVTVSIDGLCASAATLIACSADTVQMAANALYMIHPPAVGLFGFYVDTELDKIRNQLQSVGDVVLKTYNDRVSRSLGSKVENVSGKISEMVAAETWLNADDAKANGFVDEITGEVETNFDDANKLLFVNSLEVDCRKFNTEKLKAAMVAKTEEKKMDDKTLLQKISALLTGGKKSEETPEPINTVNDEVNDAVKAATEKEISRIRNLTAMKNDNPAVNALIDVAIKDGKSAEEIQNYVNAVKENTPPEKSESKTAEMILDLIRDNLNSGAEGVDGSSAPPTTPEEKKKSEDDAAVNLIVDAANKIYGKKE